MEHALFGTKEQGPIPEIGNGANDNAAARSKEKNLKCSMEQFQKGTCSNRRNSGAGMKIKKKHVT